MKADALLTGFTILIGLQLIAALILALLGSTFPAPLLAMLIFAVLLAFKIIKIEQIEDICNLLLSKLSLFFVAGSVSIVLYLDVIAKEWLAILGTIICSTIVTMVVTGLFLQRMLKKGKVSSDD